jgi:hypothetical protein
MGRPSKGARLDIGEPWMSDLADFCSAHYGAPEKHIIRAALEFFIQDRLIREPEVRKRFEDARKKRLGAKGGGNIAVMPSGK